MTGTNQKTTVQQTERPSQCSSSSTRSSSPEGNDSPKTTQEPPLLILKVGTSSLMVSDETGQRVHLANVGKLVDLIAELRRKDYQVVLVSSGAVGMGCIKLGLTTKPTCVRTKQAVAAAGQSQLMRMYEDLFGTVKLQVAQFLISQSDFLDKDHWRNVKATIQACLGLGIVPIINENDSTNTAELRFGDNDNLAALTAVQLHADALFLFTDVDYLYTANPRTNPEAKALRIVQEPWSLQVDTSNGGSGLGTGGMYTKIVAARTAATAGIPCGIINGQHTGRLRSFLEYGIGSSVASYHEHDRDSGEPGGRPLPDGTYFMPMAPDRTVGDTRRWILSLPTHGEVHIDDGCAKAIADKKSCLPIGVLKVIGNFDRHESVRLVHRTGEIGRAIINFSSEELNTIRGLRSDKFEAALGYAVRAEACHRGNVILTVDSESLKAQLVPEKMPGHQGLGLRRNRSF